MTSRDFEPAAAILASEARRWPANIINPLRGGWQLLLRSEVHTASTLPEAVAMTGLSARGLPAQKRLARLLRDLHDRGDFYRLMLVFHADSCVMEVSLRPAKRTVTYTVKATHGEGVGVLIDRARKAVKESDLRRSRGIGGTMGRRAAEFERWEQITRRYLPADKSLAVALGISQTTIANNRRGITTPQKHTVQTLSRLALLLELVHAERPRLDPTVVGETIRDHGVTGPIRVFLGVPDQDFTPAVEAALSHLR